MKWKPVVYDNIAIGDMAEVHDSIIFFGNKNGSADHISKAFPDFTFSFLQQEHGSSVVKYQGFEKSSDIKKSADAHWTNRSMIALCIVTADCLPILLTSSKWVCGIHAGWKGIANRILPNAISLLPQVELNKINAFIGPHIQQQSFEVDMVTANTIWTSYLSSTNCKQDLHTYLQDNQNNSLAIQKSDSKVLISLEKMALQQWLLQDLPLANIWSSERDTFTHAKYFSYRKDNSQIGRQISFICRISPYKS